MEEPSVWLDQGRWIVGFWVSAFILFLLYPFPKPKKKTRKPRKKMDINELDDIEEFLAVEVTQNEED